MGPSKEIWHTNYPGVTLTHKSLKMQVKPTFIAGFITMHLL